VAYFSAGRWTLKEGHDEESFVKAWLGTVDMDPPIAGLRVRPRLLKDLDHEGHYLSFAEWESHEAIDAFRSRPDFPGAIAGIREHADFTIFTLQEIH
jgi:heme-degrading monooxygenase HmoA